MPIHPTSVGMERKLAAILSADVAGYSRLMGEPEPKVTPRNDTLSYTPEKGSAFLSLEA